MVAGECVSGFNCHSVWNCKSASPDFYFYFHFQFCCCQAFRSVPAHSVCAMWKRFEGKCNQLINPHGAIIFLRYHSKRRSIARMVNKLTIGSLWLFFVCFNTEPAMTGTFHRIEIIDRRIFHYWFLSLSPFLAFYLVHSDRAATTTKNSNWHFPIKWVKIYSKHQNMQMQNQSSL